jgi:hypothetical protein
MGARRPSETTAPVVDPAAWVALVPGGADTGAGRAAT